MVPTKMNKFFLSAILGMIGVFGAFVCKATDEQSKRPDRAALIEELKRGGAEIQISDEEDLKTIRIRSAEFQVWDKVNAFPEVQRLDLAGSSFGDDAFGQLIKLKDLRELYLDATEITGASLVEIGRIATLETLSIASLKIEDKDLEGLQSLKGLSRLNLGGTLVTDASISHLRSLNLKWLNLGDSKVSPKGVREIQQALPSAVVEHNSLVRAPTPTPDPNPNLPKVPLATNKSDAVPAQRKPSSPNLPLVDHSKMKDGIPILAQILRTGAFVSFQEDDPQKPIQKVGIFGRKMVDKSLKPLADLELIDELAVEDSRVTDSGLRNISKLKTLKSIKLVRSNFSGAALAHFSDLSGLQSLSVDDLQLSDADLSPLKKLTNLQTLDLGATQITDAGLNNIGQGFPKLKDLKILSNRVSAEGIQVLRKALPEAQIEIKPYDETVLATARPQFIAENTPEADAILDRWKKRSATIDTDRENPRLVVNFESGDFSDADLAEIEQLPNLSTFTLKGRPITDEGLSHVKSLPRLTALDLSGTLVTDRCLDYLADQKELDVLVLTGTKITNEGMKSLGKLTSLSSLWLDGTSVTDEGLVHLKNLNLERLEAPQITDRGMPHIAHMTKLTRLELPNVSDDGLKDLKDLKNLDILVLGSNVTDEGLKHLLPLRGILNILSLDRTKITNDGLLQFKDFSRLEYLLLKETSITDAGLAHLKSMPKLRRIDLEGTAVTEDAVEKYRKTLPPYRTVNR